MSKSQTNFDAPNADQDATPAAAWMEQMQKFHLSPNAFTPMLESFSTLAQAWWKDPKKLMEQQTALYQSYLKLWAHMTENALGQESANVANPAKGDRRFSHDAWQENLLFDFMKQSYLLTSNWLLDMAHNAEGLSEKERQKAEFHAQMFVDSLAPTNFPFSNPEVLQATVESHGQNLLNGLNNMLKDMQRGGISITDYEAFEVGGNLAATPGNVVYRNRLFELIQYSPSTPKAHATPLLICPPWINRYYILDLQAKNSLAKYAVDQGLTVFMISWKNPDESYRDVSFEDYLNEGIFDAITQVLAITGQPSCNAVGYCIGGTLLGTALAVMEKAGDKRINSATFLTTLMDFENAGEMDVFIDEQQVSELEAKMAEKGYLDGKEMAATFSALRANDMIWGFVINNYLLGKDPFPFDLLYWNDDPTRMPAAMHSYYLRNMYLNNNLIKKDCLTLCGQKVDISAISVPMYMLAAASDHITPWESCYKPFADMASTDKTFTLTKAGHVAGVVSPPTPKGKPVKRAYWTGKPTDKTGNSWLKKAPEAPDSWWPHWAKWVKDRSGNEQEAPKTPGGPKHKVLEAAPGRYVKERC